MIVAKQGHKTPDIFSEINTFLFTLTEPGDDGNDKELDERAAIFSKVSAHTIKQILELLCDESVSY